MKNGTDAERRAHHRELIRELVAREFPGSEVEVVPADADEVICVRCQEPRALYRLRIAFEVLEDARDDTEIRRAIQDQGAVEQMRGSPGDTVLLTYRDGEIVVASPNRA